MRILSVSTIFPGVLAPHQGVFIKERLRHLPTGIETRVLRLRPWFPLLGLARPHLARSPREEVVDGLPVSDRRFFYWPGIRKHTDGDRLASALERYVRRMPERPDVLDAHFAYPTGYGAVIVGQRLDLPVVITLRGTLDSYLGDARREPIARGLRGATRVIAVSSSLAERARAVVGADLDVRVIPNGIDADLFAPRPQAACRAALGLDGEGPVLLTVGGLVPRKGVHRVLEVLPDVVARHPGLRYVVVGGGGVEGDFATEVRRMIGERGLDENVMLTGAIPHRELPDWYGAADLFVLSTSNEGWANVLQESLAAGTPVVTTDVGGNREVVGNEEHGIIVPFGDAKALSSGIFAGLDRVWDRPRISCYGRRRDWAAVGRDVAAVFREVSGGG